jgi:hypothetical protein
VKKLLCLISLCLAPIGCIIDMSDNQTNNNIPNILEQPLPSDWEWSSEPKPYWGNPCGYDVITLYLPGETIEVRVALECNPFWIDTGRPPHDDYNPFDQFINPSTNQVTTY